jgi:hypothetical protein
MDSDGCMHLYLFAPEGFGIFFLLLALDAPRGNVRAGCLAGRLRSERVLWTRRRRLRQAGRPDGKRVVFLPSALRKTRLGPASDACIQTRKPRRDVRAQNRPANRCGEVLAKRAPRRQVIAVVSHLLFQTVQSLYARCCRVCIFH